MFTVLKRSYDKSILRAQTSTKADAIRFWRQDDLFNGNFHVQGYISDKKKS